MPNERKRSQWGDEERAAVGAPHRTPRAGVEIRHVSDLAAPHHIDEDITSNYATHDERQVHRENKPTPFRIRKLEAFKDDVLERLPRLEGNVEFLVGAEKARTKRADEARAWWRAFGLKVGGGIILAVAGGAVRWWLS